jgi:DNA-binding beta-propeller fold protein YncE
MHRPFRTLRRRSIAAVAVLAAVLVMGLVAPSTAATSVNLVPIRQVGGPGHADVYPWGLATTLDGKVLMTDYWNWRVVQFNTDGTFDRQVVGPSWSGPSIHQAPYGIAVDPRNGDFYFGDVDSGATVDKYTAGGSFLYSVGGPTSGSGTGRYVYPAYVAVASTGNLVVADSRDNNLVMVSPTGAELFTFGTTSPGRVQTPRGIAICHHCDSVSSDLLFVAEANGRRVDVFRLNDGGTTASSVSFVRQFGTSGTGPGRFGGDMRGVAVDEVNKWVYVVDAGTGWVSKWTTTGTYLLRFGGFGTNPGQFVGGGRGVTVDHDGNVWVADLPDFKAQKFTPSGQFLLATATNGPPPGGFNASAGVAVDTVGNIFVADQRNWRIQRFDASGQYVLDWGARGGGGQGLNYARGVAVDPTSGAVVVADTDNQVVKKYTGTGQFLWSAAGKAYQVDVGPDGRVYVADWNARRVKILNGSNGALISQFGPGQMVTPNGIARDPVDGTIWVTDRGRRNVQHYSTTGTLLGTLGSSSGTSSLSNPGDVEVDADFIYVADSGQGRVKVWRRNGTFVGSFGAGSFGNMLFPWGMDLSPTGTLLVVEQNGERVLEFRLVYT